MFAYASALVELGYFDAIDTNFLIVGHTHSSIDQYISVLSKAIKVRSSLVRLSVCKPFVAKHTKTERALQ